MGITIAVQKKTVVKAKVKRRKPKNPQPILPGSIRTGPKDSGGHKWTAEELESVLDGTPLQTNTAIQPRPPRTRAPAETVEYRRRLVLRLVIRGVPKAVIAEHLGVTLDTVYGDVKDLNRDMRNELRNFDYPSYIGMSVAFYDEARNLALRMASTVDDSSVRVSALKAAIAAEDSKHNFFTKVGLHKVTTPTDPFNSMQTGRQGSYSDENDMSKFLSLVNASVENIVDVQPV